MKFCRVLMPMFFSTCTFLGMVSSYVLLEGGWCMFGSCSCEIVDEGCGPLAPPALLLCCHNYQAAKVVVE